MSREELHHQNYSSAPDLIFPLPTIIAMKNIESVSVHAWIASSVQFILRVAQIRLWRGFDVSLKKTTAVARSSQNQTKEI